MTTLPESFGKLKIRKSNEVDRGVCFMVYGPAGAGKSSLCASVVDSEWGSPLLYMDAEGGSSVVSHRGDIDVIDIHSWREIDGFTKQVKADLPAFQARWKSVLFDNCSEYVNLLTRQITGDDETPSQPEWGKMALDFIQFIKTWRDISRQGTNVFFIAWDDEEQNDMKQVKHNLQLTPKLKREIPGMVDMIGFLTVDDRDPQFRRILDFSPSRKTVSKFRRNQSENALKIPFSIKYGIDQMPMPDILAVMRGGQDWPTNKYTTPKQ